MARSRTDSANQAHVGEQGSDKACHTLSGDQLAPEEASIERLMELRRGHWRIENSLHYVKDVTMGEDRSLIHVGKGGAVMSALRNTALSLLNKAGHKRIASALRSNSQHSHQVLFLMRLLNSSDA